MNGNAQGREVSSPVSRATDPQWQGMLFPSPGIRPQEDLYIDRSTKLYNGTASYVGLGSPGGGKNDSLASGSKAGKTHRHDEGYAFGEAAPPKIQPRIRQLQDEAVCKKSTSSASTDKSLATWPGRAGKKARRPILCWQPPLKAIRKSRRRKE